MHVSSDCSG